MDDERFDELIKRVGATQLTRGTALRGLAGGTLAAVLGAVLSAGGTAAKRKKRKPRGKERKDRQNPKRIHARQEECWPGVKCTPAKGANVSRCDLEGSPAFTDLDCTRCNLSYANLRGVDATGANFTRANLSYACLVDADLTGATIASTTNLSFAIFCRTTMPNGNVNNSGCNKGTDCCPTCNRGFGQSCGAPGQVCCNGFVCQGNTCVCPVGQTHCGGSCVNTQTDPSNCGACGNVCPVLTGAHNPSCSSGVCALICDAGWADCNDDASDGCETTLGTPTDCLQCGDSCSTFADECNNPVCNANGCDGQPANEGQSCQGGTGTCTSGACCIEALQPCVEGGNTCCEGRTCKAFQPGCWGPRYCCRGSGEPCTNACDCCSETCVHPPGSAVGFCP